MGDILIFHNEGLIHPLTFKSFGVSVKEKDNPIGQFGTGLKYAIAIILRNGGKIKIYRTADYDNVPGLPDPDDEEIEFGTSKQVIRGKEFEFVTANGELLGFTTHLGKNWQPWQAFRELYCNALDEGGEIHLIKEKYKDEFTAKWVANPGTTTIVVDWEPFVDVWHTKDIYFLNPDRKPLWQSRHGDLEIYPGEGKTVFYKGIRVHEPLKPTKYTYNILGYLTLTEDRTAEYSHQIDNYLREAVLTLDESDSPEAVQVARNILMTPTTDHNFEGRLEWDNSAYSGTESFFALVEDCYRKTPLGVNPSAVKLMRAHQADSARPDALQLPPLQKMQLTRAVAVLEAAGVDLKPYTIYGASSLGRGVMGMANPAEKEIWISMLAFDQGTKRVASTIFEEWVHLHYSVMDETRRMQDVLIDLAMTFIEKANGEPI